MLNWYLIVKTEVLILERTVKHGKQGTQLCYILHVKLLTFLEQLNHKPRQQSAPHRLGHLYSQLHSRY